MSKYTTPDDQFCVLDIDNVPDDYSIEQWREFTLAHCRSGGERFVNAMFDAIKRGCKGDRDVKKEAEKRLGKLLRSLAEQIEGKVTS